MFWVLLLVGALWVLGYAMGASLRARLAVLGAIALVVFLVFVALPAGHPLRQALGGDPRNWALLAGGLGLALAYRWGLGKMHARAHAKSAPDPAPSSAGPFSEVELERYARHIVLREIGGTGQRKLKAARVLVIGAGGLGAPILQYLAAAGVGTIGVIDDDTVSLSNLQRQVIHTEDWLGKPKVFSAQAALRALNPHVAVHPYNRRLDEADARELFAGYDMVLDGSDNFATRALVNRAAVARGIPLVWGAITQWEGQVSLFDPARGGPCLHCLFPEEPAPGLAPSCAEAGVIGALPGVIGAMMALEAIKALTGAGASLRGAMLIYDGLWGETRRISVPRRSDCAVCGDAVACPAPVDPAASSD